MSSQLSPDLPLCAKSIPLAGRRVLVVNADDYGMTESISGGILEAVRAGTVTSVSCVTNTPAFDVAAEKIRDLDVDCGVHLNLSAGKPLSRQDGPSFLDKAGEFFKDPLSKLYLFFMPSRENDRWVENEFRLQIERLLAKNIKITHLDSHFHIHVFPAFARVVARLADEYQIPFVRIPFERQVMKNVTNPFYGIISLLALKASVVFNRAKIDFLGLTEAGRLDTSVIERLLSCVRPGISELMVHPGCKSEENIHYYAHAPVHLEKELAALAEKCTPCVLGKYGVTLGRRNRG